MSIKKSMKNYLDDKYNKSKNIAYKNPDDSIKVKALHVRSSYINCSSCGTNLSVKYFFKDSKGESHYLCNRCAATRNFSCAYENSGKTQEDFKRIQREINEFTNGHEVDEEEDPIGSDTNEEIVEKDISEKENEDKESKFIYLFCRKDYDLHMDLDTVEEMVDNFVKDVELSFENIELYVLDVYENKDTAYKAMCLDHRSLTSSTDHYVSGTKSKDDLYDIKYVYDIDHGDITVYMVYKKEII